MRLLGLLTRGIYVDDCVNLQPDVIEEYYGVTGPERHIGRRTGAGHAEDDPDSGSSSSESSGTASPESDIHSEASLSSDLSSDQDEWIGINMATEDESTMMSSDGEEHREDSEDGDWDDLLSELGENEEGPIGGTEAMQQTIIDGIIQDTEHNFLHEAVAVPKFPDPLERYGEVVCEEFQQALHIVLTDASQPIPRGFGLYPNEWVNGTYPPYEFICSGRRGGNRELRIELPDAIWHPRAQLWAKAVCVLDDILSRAPADLTSSNESSSDETGSSNSSNSSGDSSG